MSKIESDNLLFDEEIYSATTQEFEEEMTVWIDMMK